MRIESTDALVVVDVQNDFLPGGSLAVAEGRRVLAPTNELMRLLPLVYATRDWHPRHHAFFERHGGPWPDHCIAGTFGAEFHAELEIEHVDVVISKGVDPQTDGYSGFAATELEEDLTRRGVRRVFVCGLATDYCVKATALDACARGFETYVVVDAIAAVNLEPGDEQRALDELRAAGIRFIHSHELAASSRAPQ